MAGIEDFVVEQIINDFAQQPQEQVAPPPPSGGNQYGQASNAFDAGAPGSSFLAEARYNYGANRGRPEGAVDDPRSPQGFTIADPALREKYANYSGQLAASAAGGEMMDRAYRERDQQRFKILEGLKGLDPQIQGTILKRLGIDPGPIKSSIDQQKEILAFKQQLEAPQDEATNALKMLVATQGGQHNMRELAQKQQQFEQTQSSRGVSQNIELMKVLASLMQNDPTGQLSKTIGPLLLQMMQGSGISLAPQAPAAGKAASAGGRVTVNGRPVG